MFALKSVALCFACARADFAEPAEHLHVRIRHRVQRRRLLAHVGSARRALLSRPFARFVLVDRGRNCFSRHDSSAAELVLRWLHMAYVGHHPLAGPSTLSRTAYSTLQSTLNMVGVTFAVDRCFCTVIVTQVYRAAFLTRVNIDSMTIIDHV